MNKDEYVVLWSPRQNAFHVETIGEMLEKNERTFLLNRMADYLVLAFADSHYQADEIIRYFRSIQESNT